MFTGIILTSGIIESFERLAAGARMRLRTSAGAPFARGESLAVNGVCLTVLPQDDGAVVLDRDRVVPPDANVLTDGGATVHVTADVDLDQLLRDLYEKAGIQSLIVEGGSVILSEFIRRNLWQKMIVFVAPMIVGGSAAPSIFSGEGIARLTEAYRFRFDRMEAAGGDLMITAYPS